MVVYPLADLSRKNKTDIRNEAYRAGILAAIRRGIGLSEGEIVVRETWAGASTATADPQLIDLTFKTAAVGGMEYWGEDAGDITADTLSSVLTANLTIPDDKIIVIFGFFDRTSSPDLYALKFIRGQEVFDVWQVEGCYVQQDEVGGMTNEPMIFEDDDVIDVQMGFKISADKLVGLYSYTFERAGVNISRVRREMLISPGDISDALATRGTR